MIKLLAKLFIKNHENVSDSVVREKYGVICGTVGILLNLILFAGKMLAGVMTGSIAIRSDAFNNLSDSGSSLISLTGFKLANKKPDPGHPFGHGRFEYISGLIVSLIILLMGFELGSSSIQKIITPQKPQFSIISVIILSCSILVKLYMLIYNTSIGKKIHSSAMTSTGIDSLSDCVSTAVVLICTLLSPHTDFNLDAWCGVLVSAFILYAGVRAAIDTVNPLLGVPPEPEFVKSIKDIVCAHEGIVGIHDLIVHNYGPGRVMISLHAEIPDTMNILTAHELIDDIEEELNEKLICETTIHMDPVAVHDEFTHTLKEKVRSIVSEIDESISIHDFRVVRGESRTNLIFDAVVPYKFRLSDNELVSEIKGRVSKVDATYNCVIKIDKSYSND